MIKVVGVRFRGSGKVYYFDPGSFELKAGEHVIVDTARGIEYGEVCGHVRELEEALVVQPLRPVVRPAGEEDDRQAAENRRKEREAMSVCREKIRLRGLEMKLIDAEYTFDNSKILFYFTADGRIDFRELVKDLASVFRTRIELRQIGVRDETKILGGIGICGRPLCCHTYLTEFAPVSIKMAKEQNLSLNPAKISGTCGRLMCCLKNEEETYEYLNSRLPSVGEEVITPDGTTGTVSSVSVLRQKVKVVIEENDEKEIHEYTVDDLNFQSSKGKDHNGKKRSHKDRKEQKEPRDQKEPKEPKDQREPKEQKEARDQKEPKEPKDQKELREQKESKEAKEQKEFREGKEGKALREPKEPKGQREPKEPGEAKGQKEFKGQKVQNEPKGQKDPNEPKEPKGQDASRAEDPKSPEAPRRKHRRHRSRKKNEE